MKKALGLIEVEGLCTAIATCDVMVKAANVNIIEAESAKGGGYTVIKVEGDVGAVNACCQAGSAFATEQNKLVSVKVIPRPADGTTTLFAEKNEDRVVLYKK